MSCGRCGTPECRCDRAEQEQSRPSFAFEEHEGSNLVTIPAQGVAREPTKGAGFFAVLADERIFWRWTGDLLEMAKALSFLMESTPGLDHIVGGLLQARQTRRALESAAPFRSERK